tara:strand:- start:267 stop:530 length:264 start_codon:yes stop_codon:yes gene_type:complete
MSYLIFNSYTEAITRSDQAGKKAKLPFHKGDNDPTRFIWPTISEHGENLRGALIIDENQYLLTDSEKNDLLPELPADWQHLPNPFKE